ncbi:MAG: response regulator [Rhodanobacter sp.]
MTESSEQGLRILVVEDESLIAASLKIVLESHGHTVVGPAATLAAAPDELAAARDELNAHQPDLASLDYRLADSTTESLLPELRKRGIPACILTGYSSDQLPPAHADCQVLEKPFTMRALIETINLMRQADGNPGTSR